MNGQAIPETGATASHEQLRELATSGEVIISVVSEELPGSPETAETLSNSPEIIEATPTSSPMFAELPPAHDLTELPFDTAIALPDQHVALITPNRTAPPTWTGPSHERIGGIAAHAQGLELAVQESGQRNLELAS